MGDLIQQRITLRIMQFSAIENCKQEQDGGGVGGCGVPLSPQIHQKHTFRHRSACRIPPESGQQYLTRGKEYIEARKTQ